MTTFKKDINCQDQPLTWRHYRYRLQQNAVNNQILMVENDKKQLVKLLVVVCPNEHYLGIVNHNIDPDGTVTPSVVCPIKGCTFHEFIKLEDYDK